MDSLLYEKKSRLKLRKEEGSLSGGRSKHERESGKSCKKYRNSSEGRCCCSRDDGGDSDVSVATGYQEQMAGQEFQKRNSNEHIWKVVEQWQAWSLAHLAT
jgi:hypothetical protein